jgi:hypothetical protein
MLRNTLLAALLALSLSAPTLAQFEPVTCKNSFTQQAEIQAGDKIVAEVYKQMPVLLPPLEDSVKSSPQIGAIHQTATHCHAFTANQMQAGAWKTFGLYANAPGAAPAPAPLPVSAQVPPVATDAVAYAPKPAKSQRTQLPKPDEASQAPPANLPGTSVPERLPADQLAAESQLVPVALPNGSIDAPPTWRMTTQPGGSVAVAPRRAAGSYGISYGVLIGTASDKSNSAAALTVANDRLGRQLLKGHNLKPNGIASNLQVAGKPAIARELTGTSPVLDGSSPLPEHAWLITLPRTDGTTAWLIFVAPEPDFATLQPLYDAMLLTFKSQ